AIPKTRAISIEVTSTDPAKAALIANTLADLYIVDQLDAKFESTRRASAWLADRMSALKNKVEASEAAVEAFKADQAIGSGQGVDLTTQQIAELNIELIAARAVTAEAAARYSQIKRRSSAGGVAAAADIVSSELVLRLRTGLAELLRKQAELSNRYGEKHPTMTTLRAEIADTREAVSAEVGKIVERLANDVAVARAREAALQRSLTELEDRSVELSKSSVALRQLEREADADRLIYETFLNRFRETSAQEDLQSADARLLSAASPPLAPSGPNSKKVLVVASVLGLSLGIALVMLLESMDRTYRTARELSEATGLPVLASLPRHRKGRRRGQLLDYVRRKPKSALAEAVRAMRTGLYLTNIDTPPRVVMITSSGPGEGKTTAGLMLAQQAACAGHTVIVVDCDVRRPTLHTTFKLPGRPGLLPVLLGTADLEQAVQQDLPTGLDLLPAAQSIAEAAEIFTSDRFAELVADLRSRYDLVVLDAPPALLVSDAATIGRLADAVVYAVRWNDTPHGPVEEGLAHLRQMGIDVAGSILTLVDRSAEARFAEAAYGAGRGFYAARNAYYAD
ncbi:MAG: AAA family ATPase, partial [Pseudomonadota bacterium]